MVPSTRQLLIVFNWIEKKSIHTILGKCNFAIRLNGPMFYFFCFCDWKLQTNRQKILNCLKLYFPVLCPTLNIPCWSLFVSCIISYVKYVPRKVNLKGLCENRRFATHNMECSLRWLFSKMYLTSNIYFTF